MLNIKFQYQINGTPQRVGRRTIDRTCRHRNSSYNNPMEVTEEEKLGEESGPWPN
jgi:hypothetical protein